MLYVGFVCSCILLVVSNWAAERSRHPGPVIFITGLAMCVLWLVGGALVTPLLILTAIFCFLLSLPHKLYLPLSTASFVIVFALLSLPGILQHLEYAKWRDRFPFESMEERLPLSLPGLTPTTFDDRLLQPLEDEIAYESKSNIDFRGRSWQIKELHEGTVKQFVNSPGFGSARNIRGFSESRLNEGIREERSIAQSAFPNRKIRSIDTPENVLPTLDESSLDFLHHSSVVDFVYPAGFGYFKNRREVAGFRSHQFSKEPSVKARAVSVELIGWLRGSPIAYLSENLPAMNELRNAPTRPLDPFEEEGLVQLRKGDDLFTKKLDGELRVLGAIRATKQCLDCHGGNRGDLLGAFSYVVR